MITIAHRLSTAERADRVAVMEHGRLVEIASHDELVAQGDRYARPLGELAGRARRLADEREDPLADPAHVQAERGVMLGGRPVALDELPRHADREQLRRPVRRAALIWAADVPSYAGSTSTILGEEAASRASVAASSGTSVVA